MSDFIAGFFTTGGLWDVGWKILTFLLAAIIIRLGRAPILKFGRAVIKKMPVSIESVVSKKIDQFYPSWRLRVGIGRDQTSLEWRIKKVRESRRKGYFILGGVYLDLMIRPIRVEKLENHEHSDLDQVRYDTGGSACYVGDYLFRNFQQKSYLYSRLGEQSAFCKELRKRLDAEKWIKRAYLSRDEDAQSGISVHLMQADGGFRTTFTHKGALDGLKWRPVLDKLIKKTGRGGVLHISGYFRTGLHQELCHSLAQLSPNLVVCIDHGRFLPENHRNAAEALIDAFSQDLIDVYTCTFPELRRLMAIAGVRTSDTVDLRDALALYANSAHLPKVTVVRDSVRTDHVAAHVIFDKELLPPVAVRPGLPPNRDLPGKNNAFNAALLYHLSNGDAEDDIGRLVCDAVEKALRNWLRIATPMTTPGASRR
jgi:sugar/nucleoside kinase (ribokinase family)